VKSEIIVIFCKAIIIKKTVPKTLIDFLKSISEMNRIIKTKNDRIEALEEVITNKMNKINEETEATITGIDEFNFL